MHGEGQPPKGLAYLILNVYTLYVNSFQNHGITLLNPDVTNNLQKKKKLFKTFSSQFLFIYILNFLFFAYS